MPSRGRLAIDQDDPDQTLQAGVLGGRHLAPVTAHGGATANHQRVVDGADQQATGGEQLGWIHDGIVGPPVRVRYVTKVMAHLTTAEGSAFHPT
jgi:hypothetical protein